MVVHMAEFLDGKVVVTVAFTVAVCTLLGFLFGLLPPRKETGSSSQDQWQGLRHPDDVPPPYDSGGSKKMPIPPTDPSDATCSSVSQKSLNNNSHEPQTNERNLAPATPLREQKRTASAQTSSSSLTVHSYTIGWISALPLELATAQEMLDELHSDPPDAVVEDANTYVFGSINGHNIAIACLPVGSYGTNSAAMVASHMMRTFPKLRFGLMVGIGGGVPGRHGDAPDIRLGDVVVSQPEGQFGGVVQIDLGKNTPQGFQRTGMLNRPPPLLLSALAKMQANASLRGSDTLPRLLEDLRHTLPGKRPELTYEVSQDKLYHASYEHPRGVPTCRDCEEENIISRPKRSSNDPVIHYGLIASSNTVEKHGPDRDRLRDELGVLCFEMEAAGLMNHFPCIVIRGICDYADSHKNKDWQLYAAATAAAYTKDFLTKIQPAAVERTTLAQEVCNELLPEVEARLRPLLDDRQCKENQKVLDWLSISAHRARHKDLSSERKGSSGQWFLDSQEFKSWLKSPNSTLFCPGIPGSGKTFLASRVIDELLSVYTDDRDGVVYVYCEYARQSEQTSSALIASILRQLSDCDRALPAALSRLARDCKAGQGEERHATYGELNNTLIEAAQDYHHIFLIIDALDECSNEILRELVSSIQDFSQRAPVSLMVTSRHVPEIIELLKWDISLKIEANKKDIESYLDKRSHEIGVLRRNPDLAKEAVKGVTETVDGMFLLARLHFETMKRAHTTGEVREALQHFRSAPQGQHKLDDAYRNAMERIEQRDEGCKWAYKILTWTAYAIRPLSPRELQHALAIKPGHGSINENDFVDPTEIVSLCAGLVSINEEADTVQLVHYTTKEFFENNRPEWMFTAHETLSISCLTYLSYRKFTALGKSIPPDFEFKIVARTTENAFLSYAVGNWGHHVRFCSKGSLKIFKKLLVKYLRSKELIAVANSMDIWHMYSPTWRWSHYLAGFGLTEVFKYIIKRHLERTFLISDIDFSDDLSPSPLSVAIQRGNVEVVRFLVNLHSPCKVEINFHRTVADYTPLGHAVAKRNHAIIRLFSELPPNRVDFNHVVTLGASFSPLSLAVQEGFSDIVELLIRLGPERVDPNSDDSGVTPFQIAAKNGDLTIMRLLTDWCPTVDPDAEDDLRRTPLMLASERGDVDIVKYLMELDPQQVNANARGKSGQTALHRAALKGHATIVETFGTLYSDRVDLDAPSELNRTPLYLAAMVGHDAVVDTFIRIGEGRVDFNHKDERGWTPLIAAVARGHAKVVKSLCSLGPERLNVNTCTSDGKTALHLAIAKREYEVVEFLLGLGGRVDIEDQDKNSDTARSLTAAVGPEFVKLFPESSK